VAAGGDVAIKRVVAGVTGAAGEPAAINTGVPVEYPLRFLVPVDAPRSVGPETFGVSLPVRVDVVITAGTDVHRALHGLIARDCGTPPRYTNTADSSHAAA